MTHGRARRGLTALAMTGVLGGSLSLMPAFGQDRSTDSDSSSRDESAQSDQSSDREDANRAQANQRRRSNQSSANRADSTQDNGQRSQRQSQNQYSRDQYNQGPPYQGQRSSPGQPYNRSQTNNGRNQLDRSASAERSRQAYDRSSDGRSEGRQDVSDNDEAWLGVYLSGDQTSQNGAEVSQIYPAGPAARAGLRSGDVITAVGDQEIENADDLVEAIDKQQPGSEAQFTVLRNNQSIQLPITLGSRQAFAGYSGTGAPSGGDSQGSRQSGQQSNQFASGRQAGGQEDYWGNVPPFAMQLEHERRMYEQHERIESQIAQLQAEVRQLREAVQQLRR